MSEGVQQQETWVTHPWVTEGQKKIRFGICTASVAGMAEWAPFLAFVRRVEALGFDSYWKPDHPMAWLDCWTVLAALAVTTSRIRLGSFVSCVAFRQPTLLARMSADVDRMSGGRLILGLGTGDFLWEFEQLGLRCPSLRERQQALEETIQIIRGVAGNAPFTYQGQQFWVTNAKLPHGPLQQPRLPILIGGGGERVTLRQVAQYADMSNFGEHAYTGNAQSLMDVRRKLDVLDQHCATLGRPPESLLRSHITYPLILAETREALKAKTDAIPPANRELMRASLVACTPDDAITYYRSLAGAGLQYFIPTTYGLDVETLDLLAHRVIPAVVAPPGSG
jgi:alkanesulfonate monooxygenase SsuD/methylene tetrahydromethanopterin reductase-like flavin-dependent oxidoreductase (luciferase family)